MTPEDEKVLEELRESLADYEAQHGMLPGITDPATRESLLLQMIDSLRRIRFVKALLARDLSTRRADPRDDLFDPIRAAVLSIRGEDTEEAYWLVFLFVHFGRHSTGYRYIRDVYGRLGEDPEWRWPEVSTDPAGFKNWLRGNQDAIRESDLPGGFGNHRKYQSLDADSDSGTGAAVASYVSWVLEHGSHEQLINAALQSSDHDPRRAFDALYQSMACVDSFGRLARFDYLAMIGKLELAGIEPGSVYLSSASGPTRGARLLLKGDGEAAAPVSQLEPAINKLADHLQVGMQTAEDAICNWQKSPTTFKRVRL
jgi:hypothetical protein